MMQTWRQRRRAIAELHARSDEEDQRLAGSEANPLNQAYQAVRAGDPIVAASLWSEATARMPLAVLKSAASIEILLFLKRFDELETLMQSGLRVYPRNPLYLSGLAQLKQKQSGFVEAAALWQSYRSRAPTDPIGYVAGADCLYQLNDIKGALAVLKSGTLVVPLEEDLWIRAARTAEQLLDFRSALSYWNYIADKLERPSGVVGAARVLDETGQHDAALLRLLENRPKHPFDRELLVSLAQLSERLKSPSDALPYWKDLRLAFPRWKPGYEHSARCLRLTGRDAEAAEVWTEWNLRFPEDSVVNSSGPE